MKYIKIGFLLCMLIVLSTRICKADTYVDDDNDGFYDDPDDDFKSNGEHYDYLEESEESVYETSPKPTTTTTTKPNTKPTIQITTTTMKIATTTQEIFTCPEKCHCFEGTQFIDCSKLNLTAVPKDIPRNAIKIDLSHNNIEQLTITDFPYSINARDLILTENQINYIEEKIFDNFPYLDKIDLSSNSLSSINPDLFSLATQLQTLILNFNPISFQLLKPFLNLPELSELHLKGCNLSSIYDKTFSNLTSLRLLNLSNNSFDGTLNTKAFGELKHLQKLQIQSLDEEIMLDLCRVLTAIDVIRTDRYDISCFELVSGDRFDDSTMTISPKHDDSMTTVQSQISVATKILDADATSPKTVITTSMETMTTSSTSTTAKTKTTTKTTTAKPSITTELPKTTKDILTQLQTILSNIPKSETNKISTLENTNQTETVLNSTSTASRSADQKTNSEDSSQLSSQSVKNILIGIIVITTGGLAIGLLCRSDIFGIKTKLCRRKKRQPAQTDQVSPAEEVPLNKI